MRALVGIAAAVALGWLAMAAPASGQTHVGPINGALTHKPWIEGVDPRLEDHLFRTTYRTLPNHNVLKVYAIEANGYESAGIRFSARVPHEQRDLTATEIQREAAMLIRATFEHYPSVQAVDIWGTIPVAAAQLHSIEDTVFSVSADRSVYQNIRDADLSDAAFLQAFGRVWMAPQVPQ
jgi:hypothetical protein